MPVKFLKKFWERQTFRKHIRALPRVTGLQKLMVKKAIGKGITAGLSKVEWTHGW